jgi:hypothetical protein
MQFASPKRIYRLLICALLAAVVLMCAAGCGQGGQDMNGSLEQWQGTWYDVNGTTVLELKGDQLTISGAYDSETYKVALKEEGDTRTIINCDADGFMEMSALTVKSDGSLMAEEMILDAEGHHYHFVREEQLEAEREVVDVSADMPKTIESGEIEEFTLYFSTKHGRLYGLDGKWADASYSWTIEKQGDGTYEMNFTQGYDSYMGLTYNDRVSEEYVRGLADMISEMGLPALNGYELRNNVSLPGYGLYVTYASGEELRILASGNGADTCVFDIKAFMDYALTVVGEEGDDYDRTEG